jgi:hypothetical protein
MARQGPLHLQRAQDGLLGAGKRDEEGVALRIDLVARLADDGRADQPPVLGQNLHVALPQRLHQPGRALDIAEQEGDCPTRKLGHAVTCTQAAAVGLTSRSTARPMIRSAPPT